MNPTEQTDKTHNAREKAVQLYPHETWRQIEERIFIASSREPKGKQQNHILEKELVQARMLPGYGSTVYLLPEIGDPAHIGVKHPDAVVDGFLMEFKTITGSINQVEHRFQESRKKADRVFFNIQSPLTQEAVLSKLIDKVRKNTTGAVWSSPILTKPVKPIFGILIVYHKKARLRRSDWLSGTADSSYIPPA